jgi:hypothetical protein
LPGPPHSAHLFHQQDGPARCGFLRALKEIAGKLGEHVIPLQIRPSRITVGRDRRPRGDELVPCVDRAQRGRGCRRGRPSGRRSCRGCAADRGIEAPCGRYRDSSSIGPACTHDNLMERIVDGKPISSTKYALLSVGRCTDGNNASSLWSSFCDISSALLWMRSSTIARPLRPGLPPCEGPENCKRVEA